MNSDRKTWFGALIVLLCAALVLGLIGLCVSTAQAETWQAVKIVQARGGLRVREAPSIHAKANYLLDDCTTVIVLEEADGWSRVGFNTPPHNEIGWVCSEYLK